MVLWERIGEHSKCGSDVLRADDVIPDTVLRLQEDGSESLMKRVW